MHAQKEKELLGKRQSVNTSEKEARVENQQVDEDAPHSRENESVEIMDVDEGDIGEPRECPMSAKPVPETVYDEETEEANQQTKPVTNTGVMDSKDDTETQEYQYTHIRGKDGHIISKRSEKTSGHNVKESTQHGGVAAPVSASGERHTGCRRTNSWLSGACSRKFCTVKYQKKWQENHS